MPFSSLFAQGQKLYRILIVDDYTAAADGLAELLNCFDIDARAVYSGAEAVRVSREWLPHLVILDLCMPAMNGMETLCSLRSHPLTAPIPVVAITAWDNKIGPSGNERAQFAAILMKPLPLEYLLTIIEGYRPTKTVAGPA
ncbi:response regulator receiver domain-containing protein [Pseudoduganella lurida]|uniref:Response regulator receiver domain-containing protein n=1 Tax=Pseudoduganella lurida TaxID=1036180 RepID=A0A562RKY9_9BURK|nr:response regulator [Pseudoduganella lurida]TWI69274.1 response regulator receiver domain-containing protein [Pseudoduganella lurida]